MKTRIWGLTCNQLNLQGAENKFPPPSLTTVAPNAGDTGCHCCPSIVGHRVLRLLPHRRLLCSSHRRLRCSPRRLPPSLSFSFSLSLSLGLSSLSLFAGGRTGLLLAEMEEWVTSRDKVENGGEGRGERERGLAACVELCA